MNNGTLVLIYLLISLVFLIVVGIFSYRYGKKEEIEFKKYYPRLIEDIRKREFGKAILILDKLMWNSNMEKQKFLNIINELKNFELTNNDSNLEIIKNKIAKVFNKKGWNIE